MNKTQQPDALLVQIAEYVINKTIASEETYETASHVLMDTLGCGFLALRYPECTKHLGPIAPGTVVPNGARVPGTQFVLDPVHAAFNIGAMIRWLDFNDTWLAAERGHPSDNLGAILAVADWVSCGDVRTSVRADGHPNHRVAAGRGDFHDTAWNGRERPGCAERDSDP